VSYRTLIRLRRLSQILFLALFLYLLLKTEAPQSLRIAAGDIRLPYPVSIFLEADPLVALVNALSSGALYKGLLWSLVIILPTLLLGRFFCGWICPLGTLNHWVSSWRSQRKRGLRRIESNRYKSWQRLKYYLLAAVLAAALVGSGLAGWLDPICLTFRSLALAVHPTASYAANAVVESLQASRNRIIYFISIALDFLFRQLFVGFKQPYFRQGFLLGIIFIIILALNLRITRFWCRALCPLGALLGWLSRWAIFGLEKQHAQCGDCNRCLLDCQGGDDPIPGARWRQSECHLCLNCAAGCPEAGLRFRFFPNRSSTAAGANLERRHLVAGLSAGLIAVPLLRATPGLRVENDPRLVRPPGALSEKDFLARCIRCGECMKVCPNNALHPALTQAGLEGLWTPVLIPRIGYCEPSCTLCGQVCPTGAIWEFSAAEKGWIGEQNAGEQRPIRIGTAFFDRGRCLPWAMATECIVCEEWCPTSPKAIYLRPTQVSGPDGVARTVRQPYVNPDLCVGCGACEFACPVKDRPAIYVTSISESRSETNQIRLPERRTDQLPDGWLSTRPRRTFDPGGLYKYMDGAAEKYIQAGVRQLTVGEYQYLQRLEVTAEIYLMSDPEGASAIYNSEPETGSLPLKVGDAGRLYASSLVFRRGPYLVRLIAYQSDPEAGRALTELARYWDAQLARR